jgi:PAS domain S-box-containing protein
MRNVNVFEVNRSRDWAIAKRFRIAIVAAVLALVAIALAWPLISSSGLSIVRSERVAINDLKRLRSGDRIELEGTVSFADEKTNVFYLQDGVSGLRVEIGAASLPQPSERVIVRGKIEREYDGTVGLRSVTFQDLEVVKRRRGALPDPQVLAISDLLRGSQRVDGRRVQTGGVVRMIELDDDRMTLELGDAGQRMLVTVLRPRSIDISALLDARVTVKGALQLGLDRVAETFAPHLWVRSPEDLVVNNAAPATPRVPSLRALHVEPIWLNAGHRISLEGTVIRVEPDGTLLLDSGGLLLPVEGAQVQDLRPGETVEASGWPTRQRWNVVLERASVSRVLETHASAPEFDAGLTSIAQIRSLDRAAAAQSQHVRVSGVLTSVHYTQQFVFVQSGDSAIWVDAWGQSLADYRPGQLVEIGGISAPGEFAPVIAQPSFEIVRTASMPAAQVIDAELAPRGVYDSAWVELEGLLRPFSPNQGYTDFTIDTSIGAVAGLLIQSTDPALLDTYVDARVRVRGVLATSFTSKGVLTGYRLFVHSLDDMEVLEKAPENADLVTPRPIRELLRFKADFDRSRRALVRGTVTMTTPGRLYMEDSTGSLQVMVSRMPARVGDVIEAIGYPRPDERGPLLADASVRLLGRRETPQPLAITPEQAMSGTIDNRLVSIEARIVSQGASAAQQTIVLRAGDAVFNAELEGSVPLGRLRDGSMVRVVGICAVQRDFGADRYSGDLDAVPESFRLLLRSADDVTVLHAAPWWNWRHAWPVIGLLVFSIIAAMLWARTLRGRVLKQTAEIEKQSAFLRQVIDMCPNLISVRDREGRYALVNRSLAKEYDQEPETLIGKTERELGALEAEVSQIEATDREVLSSQAEKTFAERTRTSRTGETIWLQTVKRPILDERGEATHVLEVSNDITAHKQAEKMLERARSAAESANRAKSEFLANMSHEIRTPLNGIIGMSELCLDTDLTSEQREYVQALKLSGDGLLGVINDILDFSKIEAGKLELEARAFDLRETIESVARTLALQAHRQGIELMYEIGSSVPRVVIGDANRLRQVLLNLIADAVEETHRGEVLLSAMLIGQDEHRSTLQVTIADTSKRAVADSPSGRYQFVAEEGASGSKQSSGDLGLAISARLVGLMDGRVWAETDEKGRQLHFTVVLGTTAQPKASASSKRSLLRGVHVLVVDDNETNRRLLTERLLRAGMRVVSAASSSEGFERVQECNGAGDPLRVCIVNYDMPVANGTAFVQRLREQHLQLPVIMMVRTNTQRESAAQCRSLAIEAVLVKPFSEEDLHVAVGRVLDEQESKKGSASAEPSSARASASLDVLVAEDNTVNQMVMQRLLHKRGHRVVVAGSGKAALEALESQHFDLILMDVQMPELDGLEATREIRRREQGQARRTPIVALTAHAMTEDRERCLAAGMDGYMTKPVNPSELDETLQRYAAAG